ncbi:hypothetical protein IA54_011130 [Xanthomonas phaseoli pv. syngonii LMG 9055]|uniref:Uncharacterized protein n=1 Tax=Xanthomonas phaseoli pv. syngonii LMG 9055 TaxID=1437878 RepID=A0A1V9GXU1_9XANT|nr:hypothetical protein IA54_011130 [Xanthomonas phaseoli pv. syngonii LMG 9055]
MELRCPGTAEAKHLFPVLERSHKDPGLDALKIWSLQKDQPLLGLLGVGSLDLAKAIVEVRSQWHVEDRRDHRGVCGNNLVNSDAQPDLIIESGASSRLRVADLPTGAANHVYSRHAADQHVVRTPCHLF